ncbi:MULTISPECIES: hypothetical protein [Methylomonas]|nr:hypothetical protein [Methylomonas koyamae]
MNHDQKSTKIKVLMYFQVFILILVINPWSLIVRNIAFILAAIEIAMVVLVFFPVLIYQLFIKKVGLKRGMELAIESLFNILSIFNAVPF